MSSHRHRALLAFYHPLKQQKYHLHIDFYLQIHNDIFLVLKRSYRMKNDILDLPESLYEFAQISNFHSVIEDLAKLAEDEDWKYHNQSSGSNLPILENYIRNTYIRLSREKKFPIQQIQNFAVLIQDYWQKHSMSLFIGNFAKTPIKLLIAIGIS